MKTAFKKFPVAKAILFSLAFLLTSSLHAEFQPGDVFREFVHDERISVKDMDGSAVDIEIDSLTGATRAEIAIHYWNGHLGMENQSFRVNDSPWQPLPQPNTPEQPSLYYHTIASNPAVSIPLKFLKEGTNTVVFRGFKKDYPLYFVKSFLVRVFYDPQTLPHPTGRITSPKSGGTFSDNPLVTVETEGHARPVKEVNVIGRYEDFDQEGNGVFNQWHYLIRNGKYERCIGTDTMAPYEVVWDTQWLPNQDAPVALLARIVDERGVSYITPFVENLRLQRPDRSVRMFRASDVPTRFGSRLGAKKTCSIDVPVPVEKATRARIVLSTDHGDGVDFYGLNGRPLPRTFGFGAATERVPDGNGFVQSTIPQPFYEVQSVPLDAIHQGENEFFILSDTQHHAPEINWPGPVLFIEL